MKLEFFTCSKEDFSDYLSELTDYWQTSIIRKTSQYKTEYGCSNSFYYYAHFMGYLIEELAKQCDLNEKKALGFYQYLISVSPLYGERGLEMMEEYIKAKGENFDRAAVLSSAAMLDLDNSGGFLYNPIKEVLYDLFDVKRESKEKEIEFAKTLYYGVSLIKKAELLHQAEDMEKHVLSFLKENYLRLGSRKCIALFQEKEASIGVGYPPMDEETKKSYFDRMKQWEEGVEDYPLESFIIHERDLL